MTTTLKLAAAASALALLAACAEPQMDADMSAGGGTVIEMTAGLTFSPDPVTIAVGESVTFRNTSSFPHTVSTMPSTPAEMATVMLPEGAAPFDSGSIAGGGSFTHTFTVPGTYRYFCDPHHGAGMIGTIIVTG